jgi:hypothetical protein
VCKNNTLCNSCRDSNSDELGLQMLDFSDDSELINISSGEDAFIRPNDYKRNKEARAS